MGAPSVVFPEGTKGRDRRRFWLPLQPDDLGSGPRRPVHRYWRRSKGHCSAMSVSASLSVSSAINAKVGGIAPAAHCLGQGLLLHPASAHALRQAACYRRSRYGPGRSPPSPVLPTSIRTLSQRTRTALARTPAGASLEGRRVSSELAEPTSLTFIHYGSLLADQVEGGDNVLRVQGDHVAVVRP